MVYGSARSRLPRPRPGAQDAVVEGLSPSDSDGIFRASIVIIRTQPAGYVWVTDRTVMGCVGW